MYYVKYVLRVLDFDSKVVRLSNIVESKYIINDIDIDMNQQVDCMYLPELERNIAQNYKI